MEQTLKTVQPRQSWFSRLFQSKTPIQEEPPKRPEVCGVLFDPDTKRHMAKNPAHQEVLDVFDRWRAIDYGTFTDEREMAVFALFGITDIADRVREYGRNACPSYGAGLRLSDYSGRLKEIMDHTASLHLNRSGLDHFGVPVFDFQLLRSEGHHGALGDIKCSILSALMRRAGRDSDTASAYYIFQGMRMLRHLESLHSGPDDWLALASTFPNVPVPGPLDLEADLASTETLEVKAFRTYVNKGRASSAF